MQCWNSTIVVLTNNAFPFFHLNDYYRMFDLAGTCDEKDLESEIANTANCKCADTLRLIKLGDIDCMLDECPTDCQVCDLCLKVSC